MGVQVSSPVIRGLEDVDRDRWAELWRGYQIFYKTELPQEIFDLSWARLNDPDESMFALGSFVDGYLVGIVHFLYHRSFLDERAVLLFAGFIYRSCVSGPRDRKRVD